MRIIETSILDLQKDNIDKEKVVLANKIIEKVSPLLNTLFIQKGEKLGLLKKELIESNDLIKREKLLLDERTKNLNRRLKIQKLLDRISSLVSEKLLYDSSLKRELIVLLKVIDSLPDEKLDSYISEMINLIGKRFAQV
jgi:hypothetical protein